MRFTLVSQSWRRNKGQTSRIRLKLIRKTTKRTWLLIKRLDDGWCCLAAAKWWMSFCVVGATTPRPATIRIQLVFRQAICRSVAVSEAIFMWIFALNSRFFLKFSRVS